MINIITERLIIRNFKEDDWKEMLAYLSDENVIRYSPYVVHNEQMSKDEAMKRVETDEFLAVCLKTDSKVIGELIYEKGFNAMEIGFFFNSQYQGKGLAMEASKAIIDYAFKNQGVRKLIAHCDSLNIKSRKLLERLGMLKEGELRKHIYFKYDETGNPIWADTCIYGMLSDEWSKG